MKNINNYILEKLKKINSNTSTIVYTEHPKDIDELRKILIKRLKKDKDANLNDIDVSNIDYMRQLFLKLDPHNIDISEWDVSKVTNFSGMFMGCENLKCDVSNWNVSNANFMISMFEDCHEFDSDLSKWDVSNAIKICMMFKECNNFKGKGIENWNTKHVDTYFKMFYNCENLKCDLNKWNKNNLNLEDIGDMFYGCNTLKKLNLIPSWYK
jgi:surface protein